jgi:anhydro-N-acetylmuramic acid kinase
MSLDAVELRRLDKEWAQWAGREVSAWAQRMNLPAIQLVGSHGHTVFHRPDEGWTWQLGSGAVLYAALGVPVVCDFRSLDVASGGQGAPLVPLADRELFGDWDVALNLGGFANISLEDPALGRVAWDVGPANLLMNLIAQTIGLSMDKDGTRAASGAVLPSLLKRWQDASFHRLKPPKSLGREWLEQEVWPHAQQALEAHAVEDVLATAVAYTSWAVARDIPDGASVLVTGGGAFNPTLMQGLEAASEGRGIHWHVPHPDLVNGKEALVFAWLGLLRWLDQPNALPSVTGARTATCGGALWGVGPSNGAP